MAGWIDGWVDRCFVECKTIDSQYLYINMKKKMNLVAVFDQSGLSWRCSPLPTSSTSLKALILWGYPKFLHEKKDLRSFSEHILESL